MPSWVGRLPSNVGYPAAGSLSADEYKALALVYLPVIVPFVWSEWQPLAKEEYQKKLEKWEKTEAARKRCQAKGKAVKKDDSKPAPKSTLQMHEDDADNFLKLSAALKYILARSLDNSGIDRAESLLSNYLQGYLKLHPDDIKPNFHYVTHVFDQIRDYGPVYGFWSFTYERMNKTLKSYNTNNHRGGEVEASFMRAFTRDTRLRELVKSLSHPQATDVEIELQHTARLMLQTDSDNRGTVATMARELDEAAQDAGKVFSQGPGTVRTLENTLQNLLLTFYNERHPEADVYARNANIGFRRPDTVNFLRDKAIFLKFIVLNGRRLTPSTDIYKALNSIVQMNFEGMIYTGQVISIITHNQPRLEASSTLLWVRWFQPLPSDVLNTQVWAVYPELEVGFFEFNTYLDRDSSGPLSLITPEDVFSQACHVRIHYHPPRSSEDDDSDDDEDATKIWVTVGLSKNTIVI